MKIHKKYLLLIAGIVWLIAGMNILRIGIVSLVGNVTVLLIALAVVIAFFFHTFVFHKMVKKHTARIIGYAEEKQNPLRFFNKQAYIIMACMMTFGIGLRVSGLCPTSFFAFFYSGLGFALSVAGAHFFFRFFQYRRRLREYSLPAS